MFSSSQKRESFSTTLQGDFPLIGKHFLWPSIFRHPNTGKFEKCFPGSCFPRNTGNFGKYFPGSCFPQNERTLNVFIHFFLVHKVYMLICCLMFRSFSERDVAVTVRTDDGSGRSALFVPVPDSWSHASARSEWAFGLRNRVFLLYGFQGGHVHGFIFHCLLGFVQDWRSSYPNQCVLGAMLRCYCRLTCSTCAD